MPKVALSIAVVAACACAGSSDTETPEPEPHAAILSVQGGTRIVRHDATGIDTATILAEPSQSYSNLRPQPGGTLLAFARLSPGGSSPGELYQMTTTGAGFGPFAGPGNGPLWSPDGVRAGWLAGTDMGQAIILTNPDLSAPDTIALAEGFAWSSDGQALAITYRPANLDQEIGTIALLSGKDRVNRTNSLGDDALPSWSPDGSTIAFYSTRTPQAGLYAMSPDGSNQRLLAAGLLYEPPVWAPDGSRIAFIDHSPPAGLALRIVDPEGQEDELPDSLAIGATRFEWSPSGTHGLLIRYRDQGGYRAYLTPRRPTKATRLTGVPSGTPEAVWVSAP